MLSRWCAQGRHWLCSGKVRVFMGVDDKGNDIPDDISECECSTCDHGGSR